MTPTIILGGLGMTLLLTVLAAWQLASGAADSASVAERTGLEEKEPRTARLKRSLEARLAATDFGRRLATRLESANAGVEPLAFLAAATAAGIIGFLLADYALPKLLALLAAAGCVRLAWSWIDYKLGKRREAFVNQLPEVARVLANASSAGLATRSAVELAASELEEPAGPEMRRMADEMAIGESLDEALRRLQDRLPSRDVGVLVSTMVIQQRSGGDLVRALTDISTTLDTRRDLHREVKTLMAGSLATGYMVGAMGIGSIVLLNLVSPGLFEDMTSGWFGRIALLVSAVLYTAGYFAVRQVTRIEI